jgi:hypothetical protein
MFFFFCHHIIRLEFDRLGLSVKVENISTPDETKIVNCMTRSVELGAPLIGIE